MPAKTRAELEKQSKRDKLPPEAVAGIKEALKSKDLPPEARVELEKQLKEALPSEADTKSTERRKIRICRRRLALNGKSFEEEKRRATTTIARYNSETIPKCRRIRLPPPWFQARAKEKLGEHGTNVQLFLVTLFKTTWPYMDALLHPLFAFVLKILYIRRHIFYIDHLVYALHIHAFAYVAIMVNVAATMGLNRIAPGALAGFDHRTSLVHFRSPDFHVDSPRLSAGLVLQHLQILRRRIRVPHRPQHGGRNHSPDHAGPAMKLRAIASCDKERSKMHRAARILLSIVILLGAFAFTSCESVPSGIQESRMAITQQIQSEPPGNYFIGRRYYKRDYKIWGYVRRPGEPWASAQLVMLNEKKKLAPDREHLNFGEDNNYEYRLVRLL